MKSLLAITLAVCGTTCLVAQDIQVNRQNKTIAVTADESVTADAEVAELTIGYQNFATTQDVAFQDNVKIADHITKGFLDAGIPKQNVETEKLRLGRADIDEKWTAEMKKDRQFEAQQSWKVTVSVSQAQATVDLAVRNGANEIEDTDWDVFDPVALQGKAGAAALAKARTIAEQMAKGLGAKLGDLVYASNRAPVAKFFRNMTANTEQSTVEVNAVPKPQLTLFPQKVKSNATVYAVFAIE
ncbi:MAG TPA: SIMPL domain-containing protein [Terriglobales bacterium]|nr:SIMPL domain-containing protein [Terriglobales bacterium]